MQTERIFTDSDLIERINETAAVLVLSIAAVVFFNVVLSQAELIPTIPEVIARIKLVSAIGLLIATIVTIILTKSLVKGMIQVAIRQRS